MEQTLSSSELIKRLSHWPSSPHSESKNNTTMIEVEQNSSQVTNGDEPVVNGNTVTEDENPALEGHFLTERTMLEVAIIDSCQCQCHREQHMTYEFNLPFSCSKCSQQFCCKCQFLVHRDFHRGERKYACQVCGKSYYYKSDLVRHQPVHSNVKPHMCKVCGRSFNQVGHLITHRLVHTGEKPFPCDVCHKPFNRKSNLQKHKMIHTGERPFMCLVCGSRFSRKGDLQRHTMLHTGERPYKCELCDKSFSQKPHLLSHQSVHTGEKPYKCLACGKSFNRKSNLIKHQIAKCPALSLKRSDGSDLQLSDLGPMAPSAFFSHFNHLIVNKTELTDSDEPQSFYDAIELKPVIPINGGSNHILNTPENESNTLPTETMSLLRARLSNPIAKVENTTVRSLMSSVHTPIISESKTGIGSAVIPNGGSPVLKLLTPLLPETCSASRAEDQVESQEQPALLTPSAAESSKCRLNSDSNESPGSQVTV